MLTSSSNHRRSTGSVLSFETCGTTAIEVREQEPDLSSPLIWRSIVHDHSLVQFMQQRVQQEPAFKQQLLDYIEYSKRDKKWRTAAANAITILVRAGVEFQYADLQGIRVPGANLSYGAFDSANLRGADLRNVNFTNVSLRGSNLTKAQMTGAQFGELPSLKYDHGVRLCLYSPDGSSFAVVPSDKTIKVYATSDWERTCTCISSGDNPDIYSISYSPNGKQIALGCGDFAVRVWDTTTGDCLFIFIGHTDDVIGTAYSPQGNVVASWSHDQTMRLWDVETGDCLSTIFEMGYIFAMAFSPKGDTIAVDDEAYRVRLLDQASKEYSRILIGHTSTVQSIAYQAQGDVLVSMDRGNVRVWEVATGACRHILQTAGSRVLSPNGLQIASYRRWHEDGIHVELWDIDTGVRIRSMSGHENGSTCISVAYSPQGDKIISGSDDGAIRLWDVGTGECLYTMTGHSDTVREVLYSPKGDYIASVSFDMTVRLWNVGSRTSPQIMKCHTDSVLNIRHSPKQNQIASCSQDSTIRLWNAETGSCCHTLTGHTSWIYKIAYAPQEDLLVSCSLDETVRLWDVETGTCRHTFTDHTGAVFGVEFSPDGNQIASASADHTIRLWNVGTGECQHILNAQGDVWAVTYSPQGRQVASADASGAVMLWDTETGTCQHVLTGHNNIIEQIVYSPNGNQIASCSWDKTVRLWDAQAGLCTHILIGHQMGVRRNNFSPCGNQVASACRGNRIKLWDTESGECRHTLIGHKEAIISIAYSPSGNLIASWSETGEARLWDVETGECCWTRDYEVATPGGGYSILSFNSVWASLDVDSLIIGGLDGSLRALDVVEEGGQCHVRMRWGSTNGQLGVEDACVQDVQGLSDLNKRLLEQCGAIGEPTLRLREAGKM